MPRARTKTRFIAPKQNGDLKQYSAQYRAKRPLLQGRVPASVYREAQRRAAAVDFSLSKWLGYWLQLTFADHPLEDS